LEKSLDAVLKEEELPIFWSEVTRRIFLNSLPYIMQIELEMRDQGFQPLRVEQYFTANIANDIKLSARIDRIDGQQSTNVVRILDYKTGTIPPFTALQVEIGRHLQLPIYAYIVKQNKPKLDIIDVGIYSLADNDVHWLVSNKNNINQLIEHAIKNAKKIVYHIRHGIFDLHLANDGDCRYCDYSAICPMKTTKPSEEIRENLYTDTPLFAE
jgi:ATP-dependent helicase/DNAse subunit B